MNVLRSARRSILIVLAMLSVLVVLYGGPAAAETARATREEQAAALVRPAIVYLEIDWSGYVHDGEDWLGPFEWTTTCSGFVVNSTGYVVTAGHCIDDGLEGAKRTALGMAVDQWIEEGWAEEHERGDLFEHAYASWKVEGEGGDTPIDRTVRVYRGIAASGLNGGTALPGRVLEFLSITKGDVALLKIEAQDLPALELAKDSEVQVGTQVLSIGYPGSIREVTDQTLEPTFKDGKISSKKTTEGGLFPIYEISAALSGGMSGGPTVDMRGRVVGLNSFGPADEPQPFNFLTPSSIISEVLGRNGVSSELSPIDTAYRAGLKAYFAGEYENAIERFDEVLDLSPAHQQAQEFRRLAVAREAAAPADSPIALIALIGAPTLLIVVGGSTVLVRRRSRNLTPEEPPAVPAAPPSPSPVTMIDLATPGGAQRVNQSVGFSPAEHAGPEPRISGSSGPTLTATVKFCPSCGTNAESAHFCKRCGTRLT